MRRVLSPDRQLAFDAYSRATVVTWSDERRQRVDHAVMVSASSAISALGFHCEFAFQFAVGHRGHDLGDTAHLLVILSAMRF